VRRLQQTSQQPPTHTAQTNTPRQHATPIDDGDRQGRTNAAAARQHTATPAFVPNNSDPTAVHAWSLTIGALQSRDVPTAWLNRTRDYMQHYGLKGAASLELT
jgi:cell division septation protein DedD